MGTTTLFGTTTGISMLGQISTSFAHLSLDGIIFGVLFLLFLLHAFFAGKSKTISVMLSLYIAGGALLLFPYWDFFTTQTSLDSAYIKILGLFLSIFAVAVSLRNVISSRSPEGFFSKSMQNVFLSVFNSGLLLFYSYRIIPLEEIYEFSEPVGEVLSSSVWFFWILVIPLVGVYLMERDEFV